MVNKKKRQFDKVDNNNNNDLLINSNYDLCIKEKRLKISKKKWISPSSLRNFVYDDCIVDFFKLKNSDPFTNNNRKTTLSRPNNNFTNNNIFLNKILNDGNDYETRVYNYLKNNFRRSIIDIGLSSESIYLDKYQKTIKAIEDKIPIIYQGVLHNTDDNTFGSPDLIIRSDYLDKIFCYNKNSLTCSNHHYVIVDIKCSTIEINADGKTLRKSPKQDYFKTQILLYTRSLNKLQDIKTQYGYVLGNKWKYTCNNINYSGCGITNLGLIDYDNRDNYINDTLDEGIKWITDLRNNYNNWVLLPKPSDEKLYPNMKNNTYNYEKEKKEIATQLNEITSIYGCSTKHRAQAINNGVNGYKSYNCTAENLGFKKSKTGDIVNKILEIQRGTDIIKPDKISEDLFLWKKEYDFEIFIDFETTNCENLKNEISYDCNCYIYCIGLYHKDYKMVNNGKPIYKSFLIKKLNMESEVKILKDMGKYLINLTNNNLDKIKLFHWAHIEKTLYNKCVNRYLLPKLNFLDLNKLFTNEPIVIKDCLNFKLKDVAKTMFKHNLIKTKWKDGQCSNGLDAMVLAQKIYKEHHDKSTNIANNNIMKDIIEYNKADCQVLFEILDYLRKNHV